MINGIYCIRDEKTGFMSPVAEANDNVAIRNFVHALGQTDSILHTSAKDFDLMKIAEYDTETGVITPVDIEVIYAGINYEISKG